jgi:hypothetical protein
VSKAKSRYTVAWSASTDATNAATWLESAEDRADRLHAEGEGDQHEFAHIAWDDGTMPAVAGTALVVGEFAALKGISPREARDKMSRDMQDNGASREWAEARVKTAVRSWDRGQRDGSIKGR